MIAFVTWWTALGCSNFTPERSSQAVRVEPAAPPAPSVAPAPQGLVELVPAAEMKRRMFGPASRPRLYNVWATWCPPCRAEMPRIRAWAEEHPEVDVVLINVDVVPLRTRKVEPFVREQGLDHLTNWQLNARDPAVDLAGILPDWTQSLPVTLLVDEQGTVTRQFNRVLNDADLAALP